MIVYSLTADKNLNKTVRKDAPSEVNVPFLLTSTKHQIKDLTAFYKLLSKLQDDPKACLLKGELLRDLENESRAGATAPDVPTQWLCLDLDGYTGAATPDEFLEQISMAGVDYIFHHSSSSGIKPGINGHIFIMLDAPVPPRLLKNWLRMCNLIIDPLRTELTLTRTESSLRYRLDITTCQNDKLLFTARPTYVGLSDPIPQNKRLELCKRGATSTKIPPVLPEDQLRALTNKRINELRELGGLPKMKFSKIQEYRGVDIQPNPMQPTITGMKQERGYVYFNLNGGDSWAYYHPEDDPTIIYNFKGEPAYRTDQLLPEYYEKVVGKPTSTGLTYLAFRDLFTSILYNGYYDENTTLLELHPVKNETQLRQYMAQHGRPMGDIIPTWRVVWEPDNDTIYDPDQEIVNIYKPSTFYMLPPPPPKPAETLFVPKPIDKILKHITVDEETYEHFINWLAVIIQTRNKTGTCWVLQGTQGTGKNLFFHDILTPMLGEDNTFVANTKMLLQQFNNFIVNKIAILVDEADTHNLTYADKEVFSQRVKELVTNKRLPVRRMFQEHRLMDNRVNLIFASNSTQATVITADDRRTNVTPYQSKTLKNYDYDSEIVQIRAALPTFYRYLMYYPADMKRASKPLINEARENIIDSCMNTNDFIAEAIHKHDIMAFINTLPTPSIPEDKKLQKLGSRMYLYGEYRDTLQKILAEKTSCISRDDLHIIWRWNAESTPESTAKFSRLISKYNIQITPRKAKKYGKSFRGVDYAPHLHLTPEEMEQIFENFRTGVY